VQRSRGPGTASVRCQRLGARAPGTRRSSGAAGRRRVPPGPVPGHARERAADTRGGRGRYRFGQSWHRIWSVFQPTADASGIAGPHPAKTCGQATVTATWMPGRRARRPGRPADSWNHSGERSCPGRRPSRPSRSPNLSALTRRPQHRPAQPVPFRSGRPGSCRVGRLARRTSTGSAADTHSCLNRGRCGLVCLCIRLYVPNDLAGCVDDAGNFDPTPARLCQRSPAAGLTVGYAQTLCICA
jgi:hypothetical protein